MHTDFFSSNVWFRWYEIQDVYDAWKLLLTAGATLSKVETYQYDLVDITRQALVDTGTQNLIPKIYYCIFVMCVKNKQD